MADHDDTADAAFEALLVEGAKALSRLTHWQSVESDLVALLGDEAAVPLQALLADALAARAALLDECGTAE